MVWADQFTRRDVVGVTTSCRKGPTTAKSAFLEVSFELEFAVIEKKKLRMY